MDSHLKNDISFVAYRELTLEPFRDKKKAAILQFIGTHYTGGSVKRLFIEENLRNSRIRFQFREFDLFKNSVCE